MLKLPVLQPHLTGSAGVEGRNGTSGYSPFFRSLREAGTGADQHGASSVPRGQSGPEVKDWEAQAKDITTDMASSDKYKSLALHAEVKLAEALERCNRVSPVAYTEDGEQKPNKLRTAVSCQLLSEFAELCGPFAPVMRTIRDELVKAVFSSMYVSEKGLLVFDQLPWFSVAERLEREKELMQAERTKFEAMLQEQQVMMMRIEQQMDAYQRATAAAQMEAAALRSRLEALSASEEVARLEAKTGREELKRLRKEWMRMREELEAEKAAHSTLKDTLMGNTGQMQVQLHYLTERVHALVHERDEALRQADTRPRHEDLHAAQNRLSAAEALLEDAQATIKELEARHDGLVLTMGSMTPRPNWAATQPWGVGPNALHSPAPSTQDVVSQAAAKLAGIAAAEAHASHQAAALQLLLAPEPPAQEISLAITTDQSAYFLTEQGGTSAPGQAPPSDPGQQPSSPLSLFSVEPLGLGPQVPRCLRWPLGRQLQGLRLMGVAETERLVAHIWQAKQCHDAGRDALPLHAFVHVYLHDHLQSLSVSDPSGTHVLLAATGQSGAGPPHSGTAGQAAAEAAATPLSATSPADGAEPSLASGPSAALQPSAPAGPQVQGHHPGSLGVDVALHAPSHPGNHPAGPAHEAVVRRAYELCHACHTHAASSPWVQLFWAVMCGALPQSCLAELQLLGSALLHALRSNADGTGSHAGSGAEVAQGVDRPGEAQQVRTSTVTAALAALLPHRPGYRLSKLAQAYSDAVAGAEACPLSTVASLFQPLLELSTDAAALPAAMQREAAQQLAVAQASAAYFRQRPSKWWFPGCGPVTGSAQAHPNAPATSPPTDALGDATAAGMSAVGSSPAPSSRPGSAARSPSMVPADTAGSMPAAMRDGTWSEQAGGEAGDGAEVQGAVAAQFAVPPDCAPQLSNAFVRCWLEQWLEDMERGQASVAAAIAQCPPASVSAPPAAGTLSGPANSLAHSMGAPVRVADVMASLLAAGVTHEAAAAALASCGITGVQGVGGLLLCEGGPPNTPPSTLDGQQQEQQQPQPTSAQNGTPAGGGLLASVMGQCQALVWSGLLVARLAASRLLVPAAVGPATTKMVSWHAAQ